jgi:hypothetical protein
LGVTIVDEDKSHPYFAQLPAVNLAEAVKFVSSETIPSRNASKGASKELDELLEEQHNRNFKEQTTGNHPNSPFWRLIIVHEPFEPPKGGITQFVACFVYHHAICDGTSGLAFHRHLLKRLVEIESQTLSTKENLELVTMAKPSDKPFIPSLEDLHPLPLSARYLLKAVWEEYAASNPKHRWTGLRITADPSKRKLRYRSLHFSQEVTSNLLKACKSQSTTLTAAVQAMLAAVLLASLPALSQSSDSGGQKPYSTLVCDGAISFRRWLPTDKVDDDSIGDWVTRYVYQHQLPSPQSPGKRKNNASSPIIDDALEIFSWDEARKIRQTIETEINKNGKDSVVGLLKFAGNLHNYFTGKIGKPRGESFELSNLGVLRSDEQQQLQSSGWKIGRAVFSQSADVVGAAIGASVVTGGDGCLNIGFSWLDGIVQSSLMEELVMVRFEHVVEKVASSSI